MEVALDLHAPVLQLILVVPTSQQHIFTYLLTYSLTYLFTYLLTNLITYLLACLLTLSHTTFVRGDSKYSTLQGKGKCTPILNMGVEVDSGLHARRKPGSTRRLPLL